MATNQRESNTPDSTTNLWAAADGDGYYLPCAIAISRYGSTHLHNITVVAGQEDGSSTVLNCSSSYLAPYSMGHVTCQYPLTAEEATTGLVAFNITATAVGSDCTEHSSKAMYATLNLGRVDLAVSPGSIDATSWYPGAF